MAEPPSPSEPAPRTHHATVAINDQAFLWGGNFNGRRQHHTSGSSCSSGESSPKQKQHRDSTSSMESSLDRRILSDSSRKSSDASRDGVLFVDVFQVGEEKWKEKVATGVGPPDLSGCAYAASETSAYSFGGLCSDGRTFVNTLYKLNSKSMEWEELTPINPERAPRAKVGSGMVAVNNQLVVFAGCFVDNVCTDEFHVFHVPTRK